MSSQSANLFTSLPQGCNPSAIADIMISTQSVAEPQLKLGGGRFRVRFRSPSQTHRMTTPTHCQTHRWAEAPHLMTPASTASALSAAPLTSVLTSKRPASPGLASTSPAKKRAFTSPYHEFCQELRPLLPTNLRNSEREKLLGIAWKALSGTEKHTFREAPMPLEWGYRDEGHVVWAAPPAAQLHPATSPAPQQLQLAAPPAPQLMPTLNSGERGGWHQGTRVAWAHEPGPKLQLAAPPAPQLQLITAPQLQFASAMMLPPPAPTAAPMLWATRVLPIGTPVGMPVPLQDLRLPPLLPCMSMSYPITSTPALVVPSCVPELLSAAAAHRTLAELSLEKGDQQQLAELIEEQMTGEDAIDIAISLGMPH